jgi:hypothetical protein
MLDKPQSKIPPDKVDLLSFRKNQLWCFDFQLLSFNPSFWAISSMNKVETCSVANIRFISIVDEELELLSYFEMLYARSGI